MNGKTGSEELTLSNEYSFPIIRKNTAGQEDRLRSYDLTYAKLSVSRAARVVPRTMQYKPAGEIPGIPQRRALQSYLQKAIEFSVELEEASVREDPIESSIAGNKLLDSLGELWGLRSLREREWQIVLNFLQSALSRIMPEKPTPSQCKGIRNAIETFLAGGNVTKERSRGAVKAMQDANLDVWKGISMPEGNYSGISLC